jgi:hypothetical protein
MRHLVHGVMCFFARRAHQHADDFPLKDSWLGSHFILLRLPFGEIITQTGEFQK